MQGHILRWTHHNVFEPAANLHTSALLCAAAADQVIIVAGRQAWDHTFL